MKRFTKFLLIVLFAISMKTNAQITLQTSIPWTGNINFQWTYLKHSGFKYYYLHRDTLTFYNLNGSLYRNALFPSWMDTNWVDTCYFSIGYISEGLFDLDTNHIDYLISYTSWCGCQMDNYVICKDDGTVIKQEDSALVYWSPFYSIGNPIYFPIVETDSGTVMIVDKEGGNYPAEIYQLPGSFPCIPGCGGNSPVSMPTITNNNGNGNMKIFPNPASNYSNVYYTLPAGINQGEIVMYDIAGKEVKRYTVTRQLDHLRLSTSDVKAGTYFYQLVVKGNNVSTRKIVVVR